MSSVAAPAPIEPAGGDAVPPVTAVLLAAGYSRRFGGNKLEHRLPDGRSLLMASTEAYLRCGLPVVWAVQPDSGWQSVARASGIATVVCEQASRGMGASLAAAIAATPVATGWVVGLGDMPFIEPQTIERVCGAVRRGAMIAAPTWRGQRGHPVGFSARLHDELCALDGDAGARDLLARHGEQIELIAVDDPGILRDIDRPADLADAAAG